MSGQATSPGRPAGRFPWGVVVSAAVVFAVLVGLGTWQVRRLAWKEALLATIAERVDAAPVDLDAVLTSDRPIADLEYTPVTVSGTFDHAAERHFFATWQGASGWYVYTPLQRDDGSWLFVNRGFVPFERKEASTRLEGQVGGRVTVTGLLRSTLAEKPSSILPDNEPDKNIFYWKDIRAMAASSGLPADADIIGLFVDAGPAPNPGGLPVGGVTMIDLPNDHLQYAFTWYGLAAALAAVTALYVARSRRGRDDGSEGAGPGS